MPTPALLWLVLLAWLTLPTTRLEAQEARFFRVVGPVATTITGFSADGYVSWTNALTNATFTVQTAQSLFGQSNWLDYIQVPVTNPVTTHRIFDLNPPAGMVFIPAGSFTMGATTNMGHESYSDEVPQHSVYVSAFYLDRFEVTKALWDDVYQWATNHGYGFDFSNSGQGKATNHPAHAMTWYDAAKWCNARSEKEGRVPAYCTDVGLTVVYRSGRTNLQNDRTLWSAGYRLPTEAEWEKAARGGTSGHRFPWSDTDSIAHSMVNYLSFIGYAYDPSPTRGTHPTFTDAVYPYTSPVGYFAPNGYGLYDMAGNVCEWCWDGWSTTYYSTSPGTDPRGHPSGLYRMIRGGSWSHDAFHCRAAHRGYDDPTYSYYHRGFRSALPLGQ